MWSGAALPIRSGAPLVEPVTVWPQRDVERCGGKGEGGGGAGGGGEGGGGESNGALGHVICTVYEPELCE